MPDFRDQMLKHIRFARKWLEQAEHAYDDNSQIRAELKLMLAQAEMKHACEAGKAKSCQRVWVWPTVAASLVILLMVVGVGGRDWLRSTRFEYEQNSSVAYHNTFTPAFSGRVADTHSSVTAQEAQPVQIQTPDPVTASGTVVSTSHPVEATMIVPTQQTVTPHVLAPSGSHIAEAGSPSVVSSVSKEELKQLIRTAEKSLKASNTT